MPKVKCDENPKGILNKEEIYCNISYDHIVKGISLKELSEKYNRGYSTIYRICAVAKVHGINSFYSLKKPGEYTENEIEDIVRKILSKGEYNLTRESVKLGFISSESLRKWINRYKKKNNTDENEINEVNKELHLKVYFEKFKAGESLDFLISGKNSKNKNYIKYYKKLYDEYGYELLEKLKHKNSANVRYSKEMIKKAIDEVLIDGKDIEEVSIKYMLYTPDLLKIWLKKERLTFLTDFEKERNARYYEVAKCIEKGMTNQEIAIHVGFSNKAYVSKIRSIMKLYPPEIFKKENAEKIVYNETFYMLVVDEILEKNISCYKASIKYGMVSANPLEKRLNNIIRNNKEKVNNITNN